MAEPRPGAPTYAFYHAPGSFVDIPLVPVRVSSRINCQDISYGLGVNLMSFRYCLLEVALHELVSLFMQEVWMERLIPRQFLSFLLCQGESGYPVAKSLIQVLGGKKVVETWLLDEKTDSCS